jgi:hypothetical protein
LVLGLIWFLHKYKIKITIDEYNSIIFCEFNLKSKSKCSRATKGESSIQSLVLFYTKEKIKYIFPLHTKCNLAPLKSMWVPPECLWVIYGSREADAHNTKAHSPL